MQVSLPVSYFSSSLTTNIDRGECLSVSTKKPRRRQKDSLFILSSSDRFNLISELYENQDNLSPLRKQAFCALVIPSSIQELVWKTDPVGKTISNLKEVKLIGIESLLFFCTLLKRVYRQLNHQAIFH